MRPLSYQDLRLIFMPFIPDPLYEDIKNRQAVLFAGAGISTEAGIYAKPTFYEIIADKSRYPRRKAALPFPDLMQYFCDHVDGGHRNRLTREILSRIAYFSVPGEINHYATLFHHLVAEIAQLNRVVTTNWDPFFERALNILVPMVEDRDLAFWSDADRQVLKIHGCATRPYTLVATRDDYQACIQRQPLLFNKLRDLLATKTFVFVGYSLQDSDFHLVFDEITSRLGTLRKLAYAFDPQASDDALENWRKKGATILKSSGVAFLYELRGRLERDGLKAPRTYITFLDRQRDRLRKIHLRRSSMASPGAFISTMYQDGVLHSLNDILAFDRLGRDDDFHKDERDFEATLKKMIRRKDLVEVAYYTGRLEAVRRFNRRDRTPIPAYFDVVRTRASNVFRAYSRPSTTGRLRHK